eukprot:COSAG04_NODE_2275_length_4412_cov_1.898215_3_plen_94_part_00
MTTSKCLIDSGVIPPLVQRLSTDDFDVKKEAAWAITNATSGGTPEQIRYLVTQQCIRPLCDLLTVQDPRIINVALEVRSTPFSSLCESVQESW